jgi:hypothetical protein
MTATAPVGSERLARLRQLLIAMRLIDVPGAIQTTGGRAVRRTMALTLALAGSAVAHVAPHEPEFELGL